MNIEEIEKQIKDLEEIIKKINFNIDNICNRGAEYIVIQDAIALLEFVQDRTITQTEIMYWKRLKIIMETKGGEIKC